MGGPMGGPMGPPMGGGYQGWGGPANQGGYGYGPQGGYQGWGPQGQWGGYGGGPGANYGYGNKVYGDKMIVSSPGYISEMNWLRLSKQNFFQ